jgi:hypothetical protein
VYFIDLTEDDQYYVDQLLDIYREAVMLSDATTGMLANPPLRGTLRLYEMPSGYQLVEGENYTLSVDAQGAPTGEIQLLQALTGGRTLVADYRTVGTTTGPHLLVPERANNQVIPGVVLAFGRRNEKGDRLAVVVENIRRPAALEYGGKWELTLDFDVMARDVYAQQEIADQTVVFLYGVLRSYLSSEGIEITDVTLGGESEEPYDENGDDYFYTSSFSMTVQTDWSIHVPLSTFLRMVTPMTVAQARRIALMSDDELAGWQGDIVMLESLGLEAISDPFFSGRVGTFEVIS